jgi:Uncharacterized protein conserved in bacteria
MTLEKSKSVQLSKNFTLYEFLKSDTASLLEIENFQENIPISCIDNLEMLCKYILQPLRNYLNEPITVTSGYRSQQLNKAIRGSKNSDHLYGKAADIQTRRLNEAFEWIRNNCKFKQLIFERKGSGVRLKEWIHVSFDYRNNKKEVIKYENGKYIKL